MQIPGGRPPGPLRSRRLMLVGFGAHDRRALARLAQDFTGGLRLASCSGVGDAMIFTSLLRLVALWFRVKQAPMVTQVTGCANNLAIAASSPSAYALKQWGWTTSFTVAARSGGPRCCSSSSRTRPTPATPIERDQGPVRLRAPWPRDRSEEWIRSDRTARSWSSRDRPLICVVWAAVQPLPWGVRPSGCWSCSSSSWRSAPGPDGRLRPGSCTFHPSERLAGPRRREHRWLTRLAAGPWRGLPGPDLRAPGGPDISGHDGRLPGHLASVQFLFWGVGLCSWSATGAKVARVHRRGAGVA